jgi:hypothetical protein
MSVERIMGLRTSIYPINPRDLRLPFAYINKQFGYPVESILKKIHCEPVVHLGSYPNTFPNTIREYYWISSLGGQSWIALGKMKNDLYFLYKAHSNTINNFAKSNGAMYLWISTRYTSIIQFAMDMSTYQQYINSTAPIAAPIVPIAAPIALASPIDAISQMSHQASDASEVSVDAVPPVPSEQSPSDQ